MSNKSKFIDFVKTNLFDNFNENEIDEDVLTYWKAFTSVEAKEDKPFTENGKLVLQYMIENPDIEMFKSKAIADSIGVSSRCVAGAMRKLVSDCYVEKIDGSPIIYILTEKGKNVKFD